MEDILRQALAASSAAATAAREGLPDLDLGQGTTPPASLPPSPDTGAPQNIPDVDDSGLASAAANLLAMQQDMENLGAIPPDSLLEHQERLLALGDGEEFILVSSSGKAKNYYRRKGDEFFIGKTGDKRISIDDLVKKMRGAWTLERVAPPSSPTVAQAQNQPPVAPQVPPQAPPQTSQTPTSGPTIPPAPTPVPATPEPGSATEDEEARIRGERILEEADLIRRGAKYVFDEQRKDKKGEDRLRLQLTDEQMTQLHEAAEKENAEFDKKKKKVKGREYSDEEMATLMASRKLSDAELVKNGAVYFKDNNGNYVLNPTEDQRKAAREEMEDELENKHKKDFKERVEEIDARAKDMAGASGKPEGKKEDVSQLDGEIVRLTAELAEARKAYAETDYRQTSMWGKLKGFFGLKSDVSRKDVDVRKGDYQQKLQELLNVRIEKLRAEGLSGEVLKTRMAEEYRILATEAKINLYNAWTEARVNRDTVWGKFVGNIESIGKWYNERDKWVKAGIGLVLAGGALATAGGGSAALAVLTGTMLSARKGLVMAGSYITADTALAGWIKKRQAGRVEKDIKEFNSLIDPEMDAASQLKIFEQLLENKANTIDKELRKRKIGHRAKTITALLFAGAIGFGGQYVSEWFSGEGTDQSAPTGKVAGVPPTNAQDSTVGGVKTSGGAGADPGASMKAPTADTKTFFADAAAAPSSVEAASSVSSGGNFGSFEVSKGDNTWKILEKHLAIQNERFANLDPERQTRAINTLKNQLKTFSPEKLKDLGFGSKDIDTLRVGETINLDKAFSVADIERAVSDAEKISDATAQSIAENNAKIAEWVKAHPGERLTDKVIDEQILGKGSGVAGQAVHGRIAMGPGMAPESGPTWIRTEVPVETATTPSPVSPQVPIFEPPYTLSPDQAARMDDWYMQIFRVDDRIGGKDWVFDRKEILGTKVSDIVHKVNGNFIYAPGFDAEQVKSFKAFTDAVGAYKSGFRISEFVKANPDITVDEYLQKVAVLIPKGTRLGLYTTTN